MKAKVFFLLTLLVSWGGYAQENDSRFGIELDGGPSFSLQKWGGVDAKTGFGFEGTLHYRFYRHLGAYAGWGWNRFSSEDSFAGKKSDFEETGYVLGLQFRHSLGRSPLSYYVRAGALWDHLEIEDNGGELLDDTGHDWGYQVSAGVETPLGRAWSLGAGLKLNTLHRKNFEFYDGVRRTIDQKTLSLRVSLCKRF